MELNNVPVIKAESIPIREQGILEELEYLIELKLNNSLLSKKIKEFEEKHNQMVSSTMYLLNEKFTYQD